MARAVERVPEGLVEVASGLEPYAAHIARGRLEAEGIPALVLDDQLLNPHGSFEARPRARIRVAAEYAEQAREILHADYTDELERLADESAEPPELPSLAPLVVIAGVLAAVVVLFWWFSRG